MSEPAVQDAYEERYADKLWSLLPAVYRTLDTDQFGAKGARSEIAAIKVIAPNVALDVIDRAIQVHGGAGVSDDTVLARFYASARTLRIADGPDAVHIRSVAREELGRERPYTG